MTATERPVARPVSEDELHAYVDDRLDTARRREVEHYLHTQPELAQRMAAFRAQRAALRSALAARAAEPIPPELNLSRLLDARLRRRPDWWRIAAAVVLAFGVGGAAGWFLALPVTPDRARLAMSLLQQQAMNSHAVYSVERRHVVEVAAAERDHLAQWLSNRLSRSVAPPDLSLAGYRLLGGRLLATEHGGAAALFMYDDEQGNRLSLLMRPMGPNLRAPHSDMSQGAVNGCSWIAEGIGYAVVAATSGETLDHVAEQISRQAGNPG
jgi:anti-sigma factor RsiW